MAYFKRVFQFFWFLFISINTFAQNLPDLQSSSAYTLNQYYVINKSQSTSFYIYNNGLVASGDFKASFYLSTDNVLSSDDELLSTQSVTSIASKTSKLISYSLYISVSIAPGNYYLICEADTEQLITESIETNNTTTLAVKVYENKPDFSLANFTVANTTLPAGMYTGFSVTYYNQGYGDSYYSNFGCYLSSDAVYDASDILISDNTGPYMTARSSVVKNSNVTIPSNQTPGNYYLILVADHKNLESETNELNNNSTAVAITVLAATVDFQTTAPATTLKAVQGYPVAISASIKNIGNMYGNPGKCAYYLSSDAVYDVTDQLLGSVLTGTINAAATYALSASVTISTSTPPGNYYIIYYADYLNVTVENDETNNYTAQPITVQAPVTDLTVTNLTVPASVIQANAFSLPVGAPTQLAVM